MRGKGLFEGGEKSGTAGSGCRGVGRRRDLGRGGRRGGWKTVGVGTRERRRRME
jgi:hypothetical protein